MSSTFTYIQKGKIERSIHPIPSLVHLCVSHLKPRLCLGCFVCCLSVLVVCDDRYSSNGFLQLEMAITHVYGSNAYHTRRITKAQTATKTGQTDRKGEISYISSMRYTGWNKERKGQQKKRIIYMRSRYESE